MTPKPPQYAQALIEALVPKARRDSVVGDLLEEYHETQLGARGRAAADRWFVRQALGFLRATAAVPGAIVGGILTVRMLVDAAAPIADTADRAWLTTLAMMATFTLAGFRLGVSTRRVSGAIITALAATFVGTVAAYAGVFVSMALAAVFVHPQPAVWAALREGLDVPAPVITLLGTTLACVGAAIGRSFPKWPLPISG